jgi:hypothetical protein
MIFEFSKCRKRGMTLSMKCRSLIQMTEIPFTSASVVCLTSTMKRSIGQLLNRYSAVHVTVYEVGSATEWRKKVDAADLMRNAKRITSDQINEDIRTQACIRHQDSPRYACWHYPSRSTTDIWIMPVRCFSLHDSPSNRILDDSDDNMDQATPTQTGIQHSQWYV